jgi:hypothetical protein
MLWIWILKYMKIKLIITGVLALLVIAASVSYSFWKSRQLITPTDYYALTQSNPLYAQGSVLVSQGNYSEAIKSYESGLAGVSSSGEKSIFDVAIGLAKTEVNTKDGINYLVGVGNTQEYPAISRAFALQYAYQMYLGYRDPQLLEPFFSPAEYASLSLPISNSVIQKIHEQIYALAPLPMAGARLALLSWDEYVKNQTPASKSKALVEIDRYMANFNSSVSLTEQYPGMLSLLPASFLGAAALSVDMKKEGLTPSFGTPETLYEQAITRAKAYGIQSTYQFGLLNYANYLADIDVVKAKDLLTQLANGRIDPMIKATVSSPQTIKGLYLSLVNLGKNDADAQQLLIRIGFPQ